MNILFIFAHPDDEVFGPAGTIAKLSKTNNVTVVSLCKGNRPGNEEVEVLRNKAFHQSCKLLGAESFLFGNSDVNLEFRDAARDINTAIMLAKPEVVYTHNIGDLHKDHRLVAEAVLVACRPTPDSEIKELYMCELASSTSWAFDQFESPFCPNVYIDVTPFMDQKLEALSLYSSELREYPDARSTTATEKLSEHRGMQSGVFNAEAFKQVFRLC